MALLEEARDEIQRYLDFGKRTVSDLSRRSGVSQTTVRRIVQGESGDVKIDTLIPILSVFMNQKDLSAFVIKHAPKMKKLFQKLEDKDYKILNQTQEIEWHEADIYILAMAASPEGVSKDWVMDEFGAAGIRRLRFLVGTGIVEKQNPTGRIGAVFKSTNFVDPSHKSVLKRIGLHAETFNLDNIGLGAFFRNYVQPVSDKQLQLVTEVTKDYLETIMEICEGDGGNGPDVEKSKVLILNLMGNFLASERSAE